MEGYKPIELKDSFMLLGILGFLLSVYFIVPWDASIGIAMTIVFLGIIIANLVSMKKAPIKPL